MWPIVNTGTRRMTWYLLMVHVNMNLRDRGTEFCDLKILADGGRIRSLRLLVVLLSVLLISSADAATHSVESAEQVEVLIKSGKLSAGDTIVWADNEYSDVTLKLDDVHGTRENPITLRAATPGGVVLRGQSRFHIGNSNRAQGCSANVVA